jgi:hypothetical protein
MAKLFLSVKGGSQAARWNSQALPSGQGPMHEDHRTRDPCCRRVKNANVPSVVAVTVTVSVRFHTPNALDSVDLETILDRNNLHNMHQHTVSQIVQTDKALLTQAKLSTSDRLQMAPVSFSPPYISLSCWPVTSTCFRPNSGTTLWFPFERCILTRNQKKE